MSEEAPAPRRPLESYRAYLRMLAGFQVPGDLRGQLDPSDVVQETLLKAFKNENQCRAGTEPEWAAWLRGILQNAMIDAVRRLTREQSLVDQVTTSSKWIEVVIVDPELSPGEQAQRHEELEQLAAALDQLPEDQRTAVQLHELEKYSVEAVAGLMGRGKSAVGGLLRRGKRRLRELLNS